MADRTFLVYSGDNFETNEKYSPFKFAHYWRTGAIVERRMPCPTRRHPDRYKTVYWWAGEQGVWLRDISAQMPASVTEGAARNIGIFVACRDAWRGVTTPEFRGSRAVRPGIRLLLNSEAALA